MSNKVVFDPFTTQSPISRQPAPIVLEEKDMGTARMGHHLR
jgi:hypothetical protein